MISTFRRPGPRRGRRTLLAMSGIVLVAAIVLASCAKNPVTGKREFSLVSPDRELQIGREGYPAVVAEYGAYDDPKLQAYVDSVGQALARVSHLPDLAWKFTVLDDPVVNAFAMPGGYIYITRGILAHLNSEAQLAGVLGHEIGHVTARHGARQLTQQEFAAIGLGVASALSSTVQQYGALAQQALGLLFLKYGRDDETEADELGVEYATRAGWDPREIPATYAMLKRVGEQGGQRLPAFLSTHPDPGDREARTTELARAAATGKSGLQVRSIAYVSRMDGVVYGNDPRQGYFRDARFVHPTLGFQLDFPSGWNLQNAKSSVAAQAKDQSAAVMLTLESAGSQTPSEYFAGLQSAGKVAAAEGGAETIGGFPAWVGRLAVRRQDGSTGILLAAGIRRAPDQFFRLLGQSANPADANGVAILRCMRSFRAIPAGAADTVAPARVKVIVAGHEATFEEVVKGFGRTGAGLDELGILNNVFPADPIRAGERVKLVTPSRP